MSSLHWHPNWQRIAWALLALLFPSSLAAENESSGTYPCPPEGGVSLSIAGSLSGNRLLASWHEAYRTEYCPGFNLTFETNQWGSAAARVCASSLLYDPVDMASMAGPFFQPQVSTDDGWTFHCKNSKLERDTILLHLAHIGITLGSSRNGIAASCIELLGGGLSKDQLRWIYSSFTSRQLLSTGWDPMSVPFLDGDESTHLWSELHENCSATEIGLAAEEWEGESGTAIEFFQDHILRGLGEHLRDHFASADPFEIDEFLYSHEEAISFFHLYDMLSKDYQDQGLLAIGVKNHHLDSKAILPTQKTFERLTYPFLREVYVGIVKDPDALAVTRPFFEFGLSYDGTKILKAAGYWPIREWEKSTIYTQLDSDLGLHVDEIGADCGPNGGFVSFGGSSTVLPVALVWSENYKLACPQVGVDLDGYELGSGATNDGGSRAGASRICASVDSGEAVDVGMMSRTFNPSEATPRADETEDFVFDCVTKDSDTTRSAIQIEVAMDAIVVYFAIGGIGEACAQIMGGLTMDQLRWIYSNYSEEQLKATGWNPDSLKNSDSDSTTHLWSELDERCSNREIQLAGDHRQGGSYIRFSKEVLTDYENGERIADNRPNTAGYVQGYGFDSLEQALEYKDTGISFIGYHYYFEHRDVFWSSPIAVSVFGQFVKPDEKTIADGSYPLVRTIFMNILNEESSTQDSVPLVLLGLSRPDLIRSSGYIPILGDRRDEMISRLEGAPYRTTREYISEQIGTENGLSTAGSVMIVIAAFFLLGAALIVAIVIYFHRAREKKIERRISNA